MTAEALHLMARPSRSIACTMLIETRSSFRAPMSNPHGEEPRLLRGVSNHEASYVESASCLSR
jgi:hypothetical protein